MDRSVNTTLARQGSDIIPKLGMMQIGGSDWLDTTQSKIVYGIWPGSGMLINSDTANTIKGKFMNTVFVGDANIMDSGSYTENSFIAASEKFSFCAGGGQF